MTSSLDAWKVDQEQRFLLLIKEELPAKVLELTKEIDAWVAPSTEAELYTNLTQKIIPVNNYCRRTLYHLECFLRSQIPKVEDGHNNGVDVITATLTIIDKHIADAASINNNISGIPWAIGERQGKADKYPKSSGYFECIATFIVAYSSYPLWVLMEVRNLFAHLQDRILKNLDVIMVPRKEQESLMY